MSAGFILKIDDKLLKNLEKADELVQDIGKHSEQTRDMFNNAFQSMATGSLDDFISKLTNARQAIQDIGDAKVSDKGLGSISTQAVQGADSVNNLVESITRLMQVAQGREKVQPIDINSIDIAEDNIESLREKIATLKRLLSQNRQGLIDETQQQNAKLLLDEINRLQVAYGNLRTEQKNLQTFDKVFSLSEDTISQTEKKLAKMRDLWSNLNKDPQKYEEELKAVGDEIDRLAEKQNNLKKLTTFEGAMDFSKSTKSIKDQIQAIKYLKTARENLSKEGMSEADYRKKVKELTDEIKRQQKEVDKLVGKNSNLANAHKSLINTADQLKRAFALMFSVSAIKGYVTQIARVRGEFELQQRSLQAILQNKDEADKLWQQTIQLAVRSPFQVKELVTYTKQLAAYRVESDKLYDTTKMLADVSAGLGVDMNRLILAYGQVKAANYLRGTELRQFSEAGVNILEELAKYFTEVEGRAVSVGDVFERVSKRMVTFADVEEIFKRITSEGGVFYNMQEVQAETLKGQISNLRDAIDIMLNEIGKEGEDAMKGTITTLRELISNWKEVEFYLSKIIVAYATYKGAVGIASLANSSLANGLLDIITKSDTATKAFDKLSNGIENVLSKLFKSQAAISGIKTLLGGLATLGVTAAIAAIAVGLMEIWRRATKTSRELKVLNKELEQIYSQDTKALDKQIKGFENLVNRLKTVNKGSREHKDIIGALNQNYGEYLGFIVNETTTYEQLANNINSVNLALTNKAKLNTYEKAYGKVLEKNNEIISERQGTIKKQLEKVDVLRAGDIIQLNENEINDIFALFEKKVANAGRAGYDLAKEAFKEYGVEIEYGDIFNWGVFTEYGEAILRNKEEEIKLQNRINSLYGGATASTIEMRQELDRINEEEKKELANAETRRQKEEVLLKYAKQRIDAEVKYEGLASDVAAKRYAELEKKSKTVIDVNEKIAKSVNKLGAKYAELIYIDDEQSAQGIDSIAKSAAESYELQNAIIDSQNELKEAGTVYDKEALDNAEKSAVAYKYLLTLLGRTDLIKKSSNNTEDEATKRIKAQISLIKEMNKEYEKLRKKDDEIDALDKIRKSFTGTAKSLGLDISESLFHDEGTKASLEKLLAQVPENLRPLVQKALDNVEVDIHFTAKDEQSKKLKQQVEDLFSRYNLTLDLEKLGISKDLMASLFDVKYLDLDELKAKVLEFKPKFVGEDMLKEYYKLMDKLRNLEKERVERDARMLVSFLKKNLDEIEVIQDTGAYNINIADKMFSEGKITPQQYMSVIEQIVAQTNEEIQNVRYDKFKESALYVKLMGDLSAYTNDELKEMARTIEKMLTNAGNMNVDEVKALHDALKRVNDESLKFEPLFNNTNIAKIIEYTELEKKYNVEQEISNKLAQEKADKEQQLIELETQLIQLTEERKRLEQSGKSTSDVDNAIGEVQNKIKNTNINIDSLNGKLANSNSILSGLSSKMGAISGGASGAFMMVDAIITEVYRNLKAVVDIFNEVKELADSFGKNTDEGVWREASNAFGIIDEFNEHAMKGWENLKSGNVMGAITETIASITDLIRGINEAIDSNNEEEIQKQVKKVEQLERAYKKLEQQIEGALDLSDFVNASNAAEENIEQRFDSVEQMIALEEDKKNTDTEKLAEYNNELLELNEELNRIREEKIQELGGLGSIEKMKSLTEEFVDAWLQAYKETGDGLTALDEKFDEFLENTLKKQLIMRGANNILKGLYDEYDKMFAKESLGGEAVTREELEQINKLWSEKQQVLDNFLQGMTTALGVASGSGSLSGLEEGIAGASEETVQVVAAYLNSIRFFVADNNSVMKQLRDYVIGTDDTANPILAQLRIIAQQTSAMRTLLDSVTQSGHPKGQSGIRVFID